MKTKLEQFTIGEFIDLMCGDATKMKSHPTEIIPPTELALAQRRVIFEYRQITDVHDANRHLATAEETLKLKMLILIFGVCKTLASFGAYDKVREALAETDIDAEAYTDEHLEMLIESRLERAKIDLKKLDSAEEEAKDSFDTRGNFDEMTASLMAHFKFQIDTATMKATLYARLIARLNREIKAQMDALKRH